MYTTTTENNLQFMLNQQPMKIIMNELNQQQKNYVETLIGITTITIRSSWPIEVSNTMKGVVNTELFVHHLLRRSRATRSTLQLALFYLFRVRPYVHKHLNPIVHCGRRMFLAALISAHKYLYDNTFTNKSWSKISKLPINEINAAERALLEILDYRLYVSSDIYLKFESQLKDAIPTYQYTLHPSSSPIIINSFNKRKFDTYPIEYSKKQKLNQFNTSHGIPTPEDLKVEFNF